MKSHEQEIQKVKDLLKDAEEYIKLLTDQQNEVQKILNESKFNRKWSEIEWDNRLEAEDKAMCLYEDFQSFLRLLRMSLCSEQLKETTK